MLRGLLIATFSLWAADAGAWYFTNTSAIQVRTRQDFVGSAVLNGSFTGPVSGTWSSSHLGPSFGTVRNFSTNNSPAGVYSFTHTGFGANNTGQTNTAASVSYLWTNGALSVYAPALEEESFEWTFGSEWSGSIVEIKDSSGAVLASYIVPEGGGVIAGSVAAESLDGAEVFIDGVSVSELAAGAQQPDLSAVADRPGYAMSLDGTYSGTAWEVRRADGSVAASGTSAGVLGSILEGRITVAEMQGAQVWLNAPDSPEVPGGWYNTGVTLQGNAVTYHTFVANPYQAPAPTVPGIAQPSAVSGASPPPTPVPLPSSTVDASGEVVVVEVPEIEPPDLDDGEEAVLDTLGTMHGLIVSIYQDLQSVQANIEDSAQVLQGLKISGVGSNCSFNIGPASITLQTSGGVRNGLSLLVIGMVAFGAAGMLRSAVQ